MAGPVATVLFRKKLTDQQLLVIDQWLCSKSVRVEGTIGNRDLWITGQTFGFAETVGQPFSILHVDLEPLPDREPLYYEEEWERVQSALGFLPPFGVRVIAMCSGHFDHILLAHLCLHLAKEYQGVIDLDGDITGESLPGWAQHAEHSPAQAISVFLHTFSSHFWEVPYEVENGTLAFSHVVDAFFLEAWLKHPQFHMVK